VIWRKTNLKRILFATDIHGSEKCWIKLINAGEIYKADAVIVGGDLTGKALVPIILQNDGTYKASFLDQNWILKSINEVEELEKNIRNIGYYPYRTDITEMEELKNTPEKMNAIFETLICERIRKFIKIADERLKNSRFKLVVCPGNDDLPKIDELFNESESIINGEGKVIEVCGYEMISTGWVNRSPWNTYRECDEEELFNKIENMALKLQNSKNSIFNLHAPPYGSGLDEAPEIDSKLSIKYAGQKKVPVGSIAVRNAILKYQPILGLHGHIHESKGVTKLGNTICVNPGSLYEEGTLCLMIINLDKGKVKSWFPVMG